MPLPLASDQPDFAPGGLNMAARSDRTVRAAPWSTLIRARVSRGVQRQWAAFFIAAIIVCALGIVFDGEARLGDALALWAGIALLSAFAITLAREVSRSTITSVASLGRHRDYAVLGAAPTLTPHALRQLPPDARTPLGALTLAPSSPFATAFRDLQHVIGADRVIAFIAPLPDAGATTATLGAAISAAQQGRRVIVVDCDIRRRSLTRALGAEPEAGVMQAAQDPQNWRAFLAYEDETGLAFIPAAIERNPWRSLISTPGLRDLLRALQAEYDLVMLDCPPVHGGVDGAMIARLAQRCVLVAAWDETPLAALRHAMRLLRKRAQAAIGVYVNRVPPGYRFGRLRAD